MHETWYPIKLVQERTGLTSHVIRVWEKRYQAVQPRRTQTNRRLYSTQDIRRLQLLFKATSAGHRIGNIAQLSDDQLEALIRESPATADPPRPARMSDLVQDSLRHVKQYDSAALEQNLRTALLQLGHHGLLQQVVAPLAQEVGRLWEAGEVTAAHEHFLTSSIKVFLGQLWLQAAAPPSHAPVLVTGTPAGQVHELGAVIASVAAAHRGWRVIYLGPNLPAAEIAGAVTQQAAPVLAMSIVYPLDDPQLPAELLQLHRLLPPSTRIIVGGRAAWAYKKTLDQIKAVTTPDLDDYVRFLDQFRATRHAATP